MTSATATQLQQLYIAYFGRAADPTGLDYWLRQEVSSADFAANMYLQPEFNEANAGKTIEKQIDQLYQNLFNRDADAIGREYWAGQIRNGSLSLASFGNDLVWAALNNDGSESDKAILEAKTGVAIKYSASIRESDAAIKEYVADSTTPYVPGTDFNNAKTFLSSVTATNIPTDAQIAAQVSELASLVDSINVSATSINEGGSVVITIQTSTVNVTSGSKLSYVIEGVETTDLTSGSLTGEFTIGADGSAAETIVLTEDALTEGDETLKITVDGRSQSILIKDTSLTPAVPTYAVTASAESVNEGSTVYFTLATTNVASGTEYSYSLTGIDSVDVQGGALTGTVKTDGLGQAVIPVTLVEDTLTEGSETLKISIAGKEASVTVADTSLTPAVPTYTVTASAESVNEGSTVYFTLATTNIAAGTEYNYSLTGIDTVDVLGGALTGSVKIDGLGQAVIPITLVEDTLTEGSETLKISIAGKDATVTVADTSITPPVKRDFVITAGEIATSNAQTGNIAYAVAVPNSGDSSVALNSDGVTPDGGFVVTGDSNITLTAGNSNDVITIDSEGTTNASTGLGNDTINVVGTGNASVDVGKGTDQVTTGTGNDVITFGSGDFGATDTVTAGTGDDKVIISGDGNTLTNVAQLNGVETLELAGTKLSTNTATINALAKTKNADGTFTGNLTAIKGLTTSSEITITYSANDVVDLSFVDITAKELKLTSGANVDGKVTVIANENSIKNITKFSISDAASTDTIEIKTTLAGSQALTSDKFDSTKTTVVIEDTITNLLANKDAVKGKPITLGKTNVSDAVQALTLGASSISYQLEDTAANLADAPLAVYKKASKLTVTTVASATDAENIDSLIDTSANGALTAATIKLDVADAASRLSIDKTGLALADSVTATTVATVAEAINIYTANNKAVYEISDTSALLDAQKVNNIATLNNATKITVSGNSNKVTEIKDVNAALLALAGGLTSVESGYKIEDTYANLAAVANKAAGTAASAIKVSVVGDPDLTVNEAIEVNSLGNGTKEYVLRDNAQNLAAASGTVAGNATAVALLAGAANKKVTADQINKIVTLFTATKFADNAVVLEDTPSNLGTVSADALKEVLSVALTAASTGTVADINKMDTILGNKMINNVVLKDSVTNLVTAVGDNTSLTNIVNHANPTLIEATGNATVAQILAINTAKISDAAGIGEVKTFSLVDTIANLDSALTKSAETLNVIQDAGKITITDATTSAKVNAVKVASGLTEGTTLLYSVTDTKANLFNGDAVKTTNNNDDILIKATTVVVTDEVNAAQAISINGLANINTVTYSISDNVNGLNAFNNNANSGVRTGATAITLRDSVNNLFGGANGALSPSATHASKKISSDNLNNTHNATVAQKSNIDTFEITDANLVTTVADTVTKINALSATKTTIYNLASQTYEQLTATTSGVSTLVAKANQITVDAAQDLTITKFNTLDALAAGKIVSDISGTVAELSASNASTAVSNAVANSSQIVLTSTNAATLTDATVAQAAALLALKATSVVNQLDIKDTAANIQTASFDLLDKVDSIKVLDEGSLTNLTVNSALRIFDKADTPTGNQAVQGNPDGSGRNSYTLTDTVANIVAATNDLVKNSSGVSISENVTVAQAATLLARTTMGGAISFNIVDTSARIFNALSADGLVNFAATSAAVNVRVVEDSSAVTLSTEDISVAQAVALRAATNSGTETYSISDVAASLAIADTTANATKRAAIESATAVKVSDNAGVVNGADAAVLAAYTKAITYSITDSFTNFSAKNAKKELVVTDAALNEAKNIIMSANSDVSTAARLLAATNSGTTSIANITDSAANAKTLNLTSNDTVTELFINDTSAISIADAAAIYAKDTGTNIVSITFPKVTGSVADIITNIKAAKLTTSKVTATGNATLAQATTVLTANAAGAAVVYDISDTFANLMENSSANGTVDGDAVITAANSITLSDTSITIDQAELLISVHPAHGPAGKFIFNIADSDENIVTAMGTVTGKVALSAAASVTGNDATKSLKFEDVGGTYALSGTKTELNALSSTLKAAEVRYTATVQNFIDDTNFYADALINNEKFKVVDTTSNLLSGNTLILKAVSKEATDAATAVQATSLQALTAKYDISDTSKNIVNNASAVVRSNATNISATDAATFAQAAVITNGKVAKNVNYTISDTAENATAFIGGGGAAAAYQNASSVVVSGSLLKANAQTLLTPANSVSLDTVTGTTADLVLLALGTGDTISKLKPTTNSDVSDAVKLLARGTEVTYTLSDTAENLAAASTDVLNKAQEIISSDDVSIAQSQALDAATPADDKTKFDLKDTAANITSALTSLLTRGQGNNNQVEVSDKTITADKATELITLDDANNPDPTTLVGGFQLKGSAGVQNFKIEDTAANLLKDSNKAAVKKSTNVTVTDAISPADAVKVVTGTAAGAAVNYALTGDLSEYVVSSVLAVVSGGVQGGRTITVSTLTVTNSLTLVQSLTARGYGANAGGTAAKIIYSITDKASNLGINNATQAQKNAMSGATSVSVTGDATVAQSAFISDLGKLTGTYSIKDTATNVYAGLNGLNGSDVADRNAVTNANVSAITLDKMGGGLHDAKATIEQALGSKNANDLGEKTGIATLATITSLIIRDSGDNIANAIDRTDASLLKNSKVTALEINGTVDTSTKARLDETTISMVQYNSIIGYVGDKFKGWDNPATTAQTNPGGKHVESEYYIKDSVAKLTAAVPSQISGSKVFFVEDTYANLVGNIGGIADIKLVHSVSDVNVVTGDTISIANWDAIDGVNGTGSIAFYNLSDAFGTLGSVPNAAKLNNAVNITATGTSDVDNATRIENASNSGTTAIAALTDSAQNLAGSSNAVLNVVTGAVTANDAATGPRAKTLQAFTKAVVYSISDTAAIVTHNTTTGALARNAAVNITTTGAAATKAQIDTIEGASNSGANSYSGLKDTPANVKALTNLVVNKVSGTVDATGPLGADNADWSSAKDLAAFTKAVIYDISDAYTNIDEESVAATATRNQARQIIATGNTTINSAAIIATAVGVNGQNGYVGVTKTAGAGNSGVEIQAVIDTPLAVAGSSNAVLNCVSGSVSALGTGTDKANWSQAKSISGFTKAVVYDISDTAALISENNAASIAARQQARAITATGTATVQQAGLIAAAVGTFNGVTKVANGNGTNGVRIDALTDNAGAVAGSSDGVLNCVTGVVDATGVGGVDNATWSEAKDIAAFAKAVKYFIQDTAAAIDEANPASVTTRNDAAKIAVTGISTATQAALFAGHEGTGGKAAGDITIAEVTDGVAALVGLATNGNVAVANGVLEHVAGTVEATGQSNVANAIVLQLFAKDVTYSITDAHNLIIDANADNARNSAVDITATGQTDVDNAVIIEAASNTGATIIAELHDTAAKVSDASNNVLNLVVANQVIVTTQALGAEAKKLEAKIKSVQYSITDTPAAITNNTTTGAPARAAAVNITTTGAAATADQIVTIEGRGKATNSYSALTDTASEIATKLDDAKMNKVTGVADATGTNGLDDASAAHARTLAGFAKAVVFDIEDTAAAMVAVVNADGGVKSTRARNEARNIHATGTSNYANAATIVGSLGQAPANKATGNILIDLISDDDGTIANGTNTVLNEATQVNVTGVTTWGNAKLIDAKTNKSIRYDITDTLANIDEVGVAATSARNNARSITANATNGNVASVLLVATAVGTNGVNGYTGDTKVAGAGNGSNMVKITGTIVDTPAAFAHNNVTSAIMDTITGTASALGAGGNDNANITQAKKIAGYDKAVTYDLHGTSAELSVVAGADDKARKEARLVEATDTATVQQATTIATAVGTNGANGYVGVTKAANNGNNYVKIDSLTDTPAAVKVSTDGVLNCVNNLVIAKDDGAGNLTANVLMGDAVLLSRYTKPVQYDIQDSLTNVAAATANYDRARDEAYQIIATGTGDIAQATVVATDVGQGVNGATKTRIAAGANNGNHIDIQATITDTPAVIAGLGNENVLGCISGVVNATKNNLNADMTQARAIAAYTKAVVYDLEDTIAQVGLANAGNANSTIARREARQVIANGTGTIAQAIIIHEAVGTNGQGGYVGSTKTAGAGATGVEIKNVVDTAAQWALAGVTDSVADCISGTRDATKNGAIATYAEAQEIAILNKAVVFDTTLAGSDFDNGDAKTVRLRAEARNVILSGNTNTAAQATLLQDSAGITGTKSVVEVRDTAQAVAGLTQATIDLITTVDARGVTGGTYPNDNSTGARAKTLAAFNRTGKSAIKYDIEDSSLNLALNIGADSTGEDGRNKAINITSTTLADMAQATIIANADNSGTTVIHSVTDNASAVAASDDTVLDLVNGVVTATGFANGSQATVLEAFTKAVVYSVADTAANLLNTGVTSDNALKSAVNIVASGGANVLQATTLQTKETAAPSGGTGAVTIDTITDTSAALAGSTNAILSLATGLVTANDNASFAQAKLISDFGKAVVYDIEDTITNTAQAEDGNSQQDARREARKIIATGTGTVDAAALIRTDFFQPGTKDAADLSIANIQDNATKVAGANNNVLDHVTGTIVVTGTANMTQANSIGGKNATIVFDLSAGSGDVGVAGNGNANDVGRNAARNITMTGTSTVAHAVEMNTATNSGTKTISTLSDDANAMDDVTSTILNQVVGTATVTGQSSGPQAKIFEAFSKPIVYSITDSTADILNESATGAAARNAAVAITTFGDLTSITQADAIIASGATVTFAEIRDTATNVAGSSNGVLNRSTATIATTGTATAAQATTLFGFTKAASYAISDTATAVAALEGGNVAQNVAGGRGATSIAVTGIATRDQAISIHSLKTGANTTIDTIQDTAVNLAHATATSAVLNNAATNKVIVSTACTHTQAEAIEDKVTANGKAAIFDVEGTAANILTGDMDNAARAMARKVTINAGTTDMANAKLLLTALTTRLTINTVTDTGDAVADHADRVAIAAQTDAFVTTGTAATTIAKGAILHGLINATTTVAYDITSDHADVGAADLGDGVNNNARNSARNLTAQGVSNVADAKRVNDATNSGSTTIAALTDTATAIAGADVTEALLSNVAGAVNAGAATTTQAVTLANYIKPIVYTISADNAAMTTANIAGLNEAQTVTVTGKADLSVANKVHTSSAAAKVYDIEATASQLLNSISDAAIIGAGGTASDVTVSATGAQNFDFDGKTYAITVTGPNGVTNTLKGSDKSDVINGGDGVDTIDGRGTQPGVAETLDGKAGDDIITSGGGNGHTVNITGGTGDDAMAGGASIDKFLAVGVANVVSSSAYTATTLNTAGGAGTLDAGDTLTFGGGLDIITGWTQGTDKLGTGAKGSVDNVGNAAITLGNDIGGAGLNYLAGRWTAAGGGNPNAGAFVPAASFDSGDAAKNDLLLITADGTTTYAATQGWVLLIDPSALPQTTDLV